MGDFNRGRNGGGNFGGGNRGGRGDFGGGRGNFGRDDRKEMFRATCAGCGDSCEVPFKPTGERPIFCSDCFRKENDGGRDFDNRRDFGGRGDRGVRDDRGGRRDSFEEKKMYKAVCADCGKMCELPFKPTNDRPVYCSDCFITDDKSKGKKGDDMKIELDKLNEKLDMIIKFLKIEEMKKDKVKLTKDLKRKEPLDGIEDELNEDAETEEAEAAPVKEKAPRKSTKKVTE